MKKPPVVAGGLRASVRLWEVWGVPGAHGADETSSWSNLELVWATRDRIELWVESGRGQKSDEAISEELGHVCNRLDVVAVRRLLLVAYAGTGDRLGLVLGLAGALLPDPNSGGVRDDRQEVF